MYYQIKNGDYPYKLAKSFNIPVQDILDANPGIDPHHLEIGSYIYIPIQSQIDAEIVTQTMHNLWQQNLALTDRLINDSIIHSPSQQESINLLYQNAQEFGNIFRLFYGDEIGDTINTTFNEQILTRLQLIEAMVDNQEAAIRVIEARWFRNVNTFVNYLASLNPNYDPVTLRSMLYDYLNLLKQLINDRINKNQVAEKETLAALTDQMHSISDYLVEGLIKQFQLQ
jgi:spore germination protein YaaH